MEAKKRPTSLPETTEFINPLKIRMIVSDQLPEFKGTDFNTYFEDSDPRKLPTSGFENKLNEDLSLFYQFF